MVEEENLRKQKVNALLRLSRFDRLGSQFSHSYEQGRFMVGFVSTSRRNFTHKNIYGNPGPRLNLDADYIYYCTVL